MPIKKSLRKVLIPTTILTGMILGGTSVGAATISPGEIENVYGSSSDGAEGGTLASDSSVTFSLNSSDSISMNGYMTASTTVAADSIRLTPSQTVTHASFGASVGLPAGVSVSTSDTSSTFTWPSVEVSGSSADRLWDQYTVQGDSINSASFQDTATFVIGGSIYDLVNTGSVDVTY